MWKLNNVIKNFDWGSTTAFHDLFHIANPNQLPQAELWMGAHPAGPSKVVADDGQEIKLDNLIQQNPKLILGEKTNNTYHTLPYLFKLLSARSPLSIQVHPELSKAKQGFERENAEHIAMNSPFRNFKDPNHKPELIYAITPFLAMNGFRPVDEIIDLFSVLSISVLESQVTQFRNNRSELGLKTFFYSLLTLSNEIKQVAIAELRKKIDRLDKSLSDVIREIAQKYPDDCGLFAPLILNVIELKVGQAMFLRAQTPHAYLRGTALEIMASSDNVLRAGLTSKHIDINALFENTLFHSIAKNCLLTSPVQQLNKTCFKVPVDDFAFEILHSNQQLEIDEIESATILLCLEGVVRLFTEDKTLTITQGESVFIPCSAKKFGYQGDGVLAKAFN